MSFKSRQTVQDVAVTTALLLVIIVIIWVHFAAPVLAIGPINNSFSLALRVGITVSSTILTRVVSAQIQIGLIRSLEDSLRESDVLPKSLGDTEKIQGLKQLERRWRGVLRIDDMAEKIDNYGSFFIFLVCSLITTAVTASLTPTLTHRTAQYDPRIPDTSYGVYSNDTTRSCVSFCSASCPDNIRSSYIWHLSNGSVVASSIDGQCPSTFVPQLAPGINTETVDDYVYTQSGVAVHRSAIGTSESIFRGSAFGNLSSTYGQALIRTTQCVPVIASNPVRCFAGGNTEAGSGDPDFPPGSITLSANSTPIVIFNDSWPAGYVRGAFPHRRINADSVMLSGALNPNKLRVEDIGKTEIVIGALTDPSGITPYASYLAGTVSYPDKSAGLAGNSTFTVTCGISSQNSFEYRSVILDFRALGQGKASNLAQYLFSEGPCTPANPTIRTELFAVAGAANHQMIRENYGIDGYLATTMSIAGFHRGPPYAFSDSSNALEDTLGLFTALAVSKMPFSGEGTSAVATDDPHSLSTAVIEVTRLGLDSHHSLWLLIPPVASVLILCWFLVQSLRLDWHPIRKDTQSKTEEKEPERYTAESLYRLIMVGWSFRAPLTNTTGTQT
ncbi:hypothetical protein F4821DRAFT_25145 [Hypoxylon rubiginosum]|uniref:Uncharacterized protein n=1 Tax=Hypoxylon rubiginosum TaxID=110542 RepID=A0ACC0CM58_9PEZI|nr:hypothetical protein F4821DRAFT_25145 [Hypoxylon rubiginosum]